MLLRELPSSGIISMTWGNVVPESQWFLEVLRGQHGLSLGSSTEVIPTLEFSNFRLLILVSSSWADLL